MAALSFSGSTLGTNIWARGAVGWHAFGLAWVGPEAVAFSDEHYRQYRAGLHVTSFRQGAFELSTGVGYVWDTDRRSGAYWRLGVITRQ
jgi:hypothetical protein